MDFKRIQELQEQLSSMRPLNDTELKRLREEFMIENTYNSNAIEGNTLTLRETALILQEGITIGEKSIRDHLEAVGHKEAFQYIVSIADPDTELTENVIKQIHSLVLMNDVNNRGVYRNVPVRILGASHTPPQPYLVPAQIEQLIAWYNNAKQEMNAIEAIGELHLRFECIHPFIDGNGRTGRLLMNLELMKAGLLPVNIKFTDRKKYYTCFDSYADTGSTDEIVHLIAKYEEEELTRYIEMLSC